MGSDSTGESTAQAESGSESAPPTEPTDKGAHMLVRRRFRFGPRVRRWLGRALWVGLGGGLTLVLQFVAPLFIGPTLPPLADPLRPTGGFAEPLPGDVSVVSNLIYVNRAEADGGSLRLDLYLPPGEPPTSAGWPAMIGLHGGTFIHGNKGEYAFVARDLAQHGVAVASIQYRLYPAHRWPAPVDDAVEALRWLREHASDHRLDRARLGAIGRSSGAYLALMLALQDPVLQVVVSEAGPTDLSPYLWDGDVRGWLLEGFFDATRDDGTVDAARIEAASPTEQVRADSTIRALLFHGSIDRTVPFAQSRLFEAALQRHGHPVRLVPYPQTGHDPFNVHWSDHARWEVLAFLESAGWRATAAVDPQQPSDSDHR